MHSPSSRPRTALLTWTLLLLIAALPQPVAAASLSLKLASGPTGNHRFYHQLLSQALSTAGHVVRIETLSDMSQARILRQLEEGELSLHWMLQTQARDTQFVRVDHRLTQGLIGKRVLLIPKHSQGHYAQVKDLQQFRALGKVAGMGQGWFDVEVWRENNLAVVEHAGDWRQLFPMVAARDRGVDYFPRGSTEILAEARLHPELDIEARLLLSYDRDFVFYLPKAKAELKPIIESALRQAEKSGLQKRIINEFFGPAIEALKLDQRVLIPLRTPAGN